MDGNQAKFFQWKVCVDWHNLGFSLLNFSSQPPGRLTRVARSTARAIEMSFGARADAAVCVSRAMIAHLPTPHATVLYDRPPSSFTPAGFIERHCILAKYFGNGISSLEKKELGREPAWSYEETLKVIKNNEAKDVHEESPITELNSGILQVKRSCPAIVITSTSWTPDEDLNLFLDSLIIYEEKVNTNKTLPSLFVIITGKGNLRDCWMSQAKKLNFKNIQIHSLFVPFEDYPKLLGAADLGVCLHASSSGVDLPMKVVDMIGVGLPVLALSFPALAELAPDPTTHFSNAQELASSMADCLHNFPDPRATRLAQMRTVACRQCPKTWQQEWREVMLPLLSSQFK